VVAGFFIQGVHSTCPNRDWFSTYKEYNGGVILMGNNAKCKIDGIGTIDIKMHNSMI